MGLLLPSRHVIQSDDVAAAEVMSKAAAIKADLAEFLEVIDKAGILKHWPGRTAVSRGQKTKPAQLVVFSVDSGESLELAGPDMDPQVGMGTWWFTAVGQWVSSPTLEIMQINDPYLAYLSLGLVHHLAIPGVKHQVEEHHLILFAHVFWLNQHLTTPLMP